MMLLADEREALRDLRAWLDERFGSRVRDVRLFGSKARGDAHEHSDVDVVVVIEELTPAERREIGSNSGDLLTRHGVVVSVLPYAQHEWEAARRRELLIVQEIERDGIPL